jgi:hypothetical protein
VLGHFFVRFLALTAAFLVWGVSVLALLLGAVELTLNVFTAP